jgi:Mg-chelatase subunit ChlD
MMKFLILFLFPFISFGQTVVLSGYVKDGKTNLPLADAKVRLYMGGALGELTTLTLEDGYYEVKAISKPMDRDYAFTIQKEGYQRLNGVVRLNYGNSPQRSYSIYPSKQQVVLVTQKEEIRQEGPSLLGSKTNYLTFLIDISGSMGLENRLENMKQSLAYLIDLYRPEDKISIVTYSSFPAVILDMGSVADKETINQAIQKLRAGGQTKGIEGLKMAYDLAMVNHKPGGNNKIILATDGYFGMDSRSQKSIEELIANGSAQGVNLSIFAFGKKDDETENRLDKWCAAGGGTYTNITSLELAKDQIIKEAKGH